MFEFIVLVVIEALVVSVAASDGNLKSDFDAGAS